MKKFLSILSVSLFVFLTSSFTTDTKSTPIFPTCEQGEKLAQKIWEKWGTWNSNIGRTPHKEKVTLLRKSWKWVVSNSGESVGPRRLEVNGENDLGTISKLSKTTFATPPSLNNKVTLTINKFEGSAAAGVTICLHAQNGVTNTVSNYAFPKGESAYVKTFVINNARGKVITVAMKSDSSEEKFKFRIKAN